MPTDTWLPGLYGYQMANVAEIMRDYPGFNVTQMQDMRAIFYGNRCCEIVD
jgi:hypothetical protein